MVDEIDWGTLKGGGDSMDHYHHSDRFPSRDTLIWLQSLQNVKTVTATYYVTDQDDIIICDNTVAIAIYLPLSRSDGRHVTVTRINSGGVSVTRSSTDTINGETVKAVNNDDSWTFKAISGGWVRI
jgi:hypothetical protein